MPAKAEAVAVAEAVAMPVSSIRMLDGLKLEVVGLRERLWTSYRQTGDNSKAISGNVPLVFGLRSTGLRQVFDWASAG